MKILKNFLIIVLLIVVTFALCSMSSLTMPFFKSAEAEENRYYFSEIDDENLSKLYLKFVNAIESKKSFIVIDSSYTNDDIEYVLKSIDRDYPEFIYFSKKISFKTIGPLKIVYPEYLDINESLFNGTVNEIINNASEFSGIDKIEYIYKYLVDHIEYDSVDILSFSAYGALVNGKGSCEGYANAFAYILSKLNIPNRIVSGQVDGINHRWNSININGKWYEFDATFDDVDKDNWEYFMVESAH